jgi:cytoskeleton protein RodZ
MNEPGVGASLPDSEWARPVLLQQAREQAGLHIAALAAALKVPVRKLEALEAGRYDELPDLTFARALASSACRHLRVDPGPVLAQIPQGRRPALGEMSESLNTPFRPAQEPSGASAQLRPARRVWWVAGLLLVAAVALYFWPGATDFLRQAQTPVQSAPTPPLAPAIEAPLSAPALEQDKPATEQALPLLLPDTSGEASSPVPPVPVEAAGTATGPVAAATLSAPDASKLLVIRAQSETWVEVVNGSGSVVIQRVLRAGDSIEFSAAPPYRVVVGRADVVEVFVRGRPFDVMPHARNSVARFEVR